MAESKTEKAKAPKKDKKLQKRGIQHNSIANVCLKDAYTVKFKKISLILIYIITELYAIFYHMKFRLIAPIAPAPFYSNHVI